MSPLTIAIMLTVVMVVPAAFAQSADMPEVTTQEASQAVEVIPFVYSPIVINEIELNPPGQDGIDAYEWVELYNPSREYVVIDNWTLGTQTEKSMIEITQNVTLRPGQYFTLTSINELFDDSGEFLLLYNENGSAVDQAQLSADIADDSQTWQRDRRSNADAEWTLKKGTRGYTNIINPLSTNSSIVLEVSTDKKAYSIGEKIHVKGSVTGVNLDTTSFFVTPKVSISVNGPNYTHSTVFAPDDEQEFGTTLSVRNPRGEASAYDIVVKFAGSISSMSFIITDEELADTSAVGGLDIYTDRAVYRPGDTVIILAKSGELFDFEGLEFAINSPEGKTISNGVLYPSDPSHSTALRTIDEEIVGDAQFGTKFYLDIVAPVFGVYEITGRYGELRDSTAFEIERDARGTEDLSLLTDKSSYIVGETVTISGRVNKAWVGSFSIDIVHQQNLAVITSDIEDRVTTFSIHDTVITQPDGRFSYRFDIPDEPIRVGKYVITAYESTLSRTLAFNVHDNISAYDGRAFSINTDKVEYSLGEKITFFGKLDVSNRYVADSTILIKLVPEDIPNADELIVTVLPDSTGRYKLVNTIEYGVFEIGTYAVNASYIHATEAALLANSERLGTYSIKRINAVPIHTDATTIEIIAPQDLGEERFTVELDGDTYEFGDVVNVSGVVADAIDIPALTIGILGPNGKSIAHSVMVMSNGTYSFDWQTPTMQTERNLGAYTATVSFEEFVKAVVFDVGRILEGVSESMPITLDYDKELYQNGETVTISGRVLVPDTTGKYNVVPDTVRIAIAPASSPLSPVVEFNVFPDSAGAYSVSEVLSKGKYPDGTYIVSSGYTNYKMQDTIHIGVIPPGIRADTN